MRVPRADPMFWKASFVGAKMVRLGVLLTVSTREALTRAPRSEVSSAARRVSAALTGRVRRRSIT